MFQETQSVRSFFDRLAQGQELDGLAALVTLFVGLGFAFNYIASAPAYVLHLYRCHLIQVDNPKTWTRWGNGVLIAITIAVVAAAVVALTSFAVHARLVALVIFGATTIASLLAFISVSNNAQKITNFYASLARDRAKARVPNVDSQDLLPQTRREYIESYRHLREHGNAYAIVMLNVALMCLLSLAETIQHVGLILAVWTFPAALGWFVGTALESRMQELDRTNP